MKFWSKIDFFAKENEIFIIKRRKFQNNLIFAKNGHFGQPKIFCPKTRGLTILNFAFSPIGSASGKRQTDIIIDKVKIIEPQAP